MRNLPSRYLPFGLGLLPLVPGWLAAIIQYGLDQHVLVVGTEVVVSAIVLGVPVWEHSLRRESFPRPRWRSWIAHGLVAAVFALVWVWMYYALNPYRVRPVWDALVSSSAASFQVAMGISLYVAYTAIGSQLRRRRAVSAVPALEMRSPAVEQLSCRVGRRTILIPVQEIRRIEGSDDYAAVYIKDRRLLTSYRLSELAAALSPARFIRIHRSHIVNVDFVAGFEQTDGSRVCVIMKSGERVRASRAGTQALRESPWFRQTP